MEKSIHPTTRKVVFTCNCGSSVTVMSTLDRESFSTEVCDKCHPFYTGKQRILDTAGAVDRYKNRYAGLSESFNSGE